MSRRAARGRGAGQPVTGIWLASLRIGWLVLAILTIGIDVLGIPTAFNDLQHTCTVKATCLPDQLTHPLAATLQAQGISLQFYATYLTALDGVVIALYVLVACTLFIRRSNDLLALFTATMLLLFGGLRFPHAPAILAARSPDWWLLVQVLTFSGSACLSTFCYIFPSGRFVPRWTLLIAVVWLIPQIPEYFFPGSALDPNQWSPLLQAGGFLGFVASVVVAQVFRYHYVSNRVQRYQTKWVVFGLVMALVGFLTLAFVLPLAFPTITYQSSLSYLLAQGATYAVMLMLPLSLGVAMLRYQLFDIDVLINRALVYGLLTIVLALIYFGSIIILQTFFRTILGRESPLEIAASTLAIILLFQPLRQRIQSQIDRAFYRSKYDAAQVLTAFSASLLDEVELRDISTQLFMVVEETMQPTHISLWLRAPRVIRATEVATIPSAEQEH